MTRRRARQTEEALTAEKRERSARSREEAVARLRRNREEVQRRQRRVLDTSNTYVRGEENLRGWRPQVFKSRNSIM